MKMVFYPTSVLKPASCIIYFRIQGALHYFSSSLAEIVKISTMSLLRRFRSGSSLAKLKNFFVLDSFFYKDQACFVAGTRCSILPA
jgi:hypothetical protein